MMKKVLLLLFMAFVFIGAKAQHKVNGLTLQPQIGINASTLTNDDKAKYKLGVVAGAELEYQASNLLGIAVGLQYSMQGTAVKNTNAMKLDYLIVPIRAKVYVARNFSLNAGAQLGFLTNAKWDEVDIKARSKTFDFAIPLGASYEIANVVIDARYNLGLTNVLEKESDSKNSVLMLTVGYRFDL